MRIYIRTISRIYTYTRELYILKYLAREYIGTRRCAIIPMLGRWKKEKAENKDRTFKTLIVYDTSFLSRSDIYVYVCVKHFHAASVPLVILKYAAVVVIIVENKKQKIVLTATDYRSVCLCVYLYNMLYRGEYKVRKRKPHLFRDNEAHARQRPLHY